MYKLQVQCEGEALLMFQQPRLPDAVKRRRNAQISSDWSAAPPLLPLMTLPSTNLNLVRSVQCQ